MKLDEKHPMNRELIRTLKDQSRIRYSEEPIASPEQHSDPYMEAGTHPDAVARLWDELGSSLPVDCRALVYGTPALIHPVEGIVLALGYGTEYVIRVPKECLPAAREVGCTSEREWTGGGKTKIDQELGADWVFSSWSEDEKLWVLRAYEQSEGT